MSNPKRVHPVAAVSSGIRMLREAFFPLIILLIFGGGESGPWAVFELIAVPVIIVLLIGYGILDWLRFTYWIEGGELRIESGVFVRKKRYIRFERIHSLDTSEGILQRLFGLVKLKIETAGSSGEQAEATLTAITKNEADRITTIFNDVKRSGKVHSTVDLETESAEAPNGRQEQEDKRVFQQSFKELFIMALTSGGVGVVFSGALALFGQFEELIPYNRLFKGVEQFINGSVVFIFIIVLFVLLFAYMVATAGILFKYAYFMVKKSEEKIIISRGLFEKRQLTIPLEKIQALRITENIIRQPLGYASVYVEYAGGSILDKESSQIMLFPLIKKERIQVLTEQFIPEYQIDVKINPIPQRAFRRYLYRVLMIVVPIAAVLSFFFRPMGSLSLLLLPVGAIWAYLCYRAAGWNITGNQLQLRSRYFSKQTMIFQKKRIQALYSDVSQFQKRIKLGSISAVVASGAGPRSGKVIDLEESDSEKIREWFA
ncbi:PH domain-containing protein [Bacillus sp. V5-8f]|uniref:PH domain-containing protein n=1 Tax=Bacillus sp. V5-8f TaxID=2053044 RepID=UPI0015E09423|nr:PH domain-containing protein [Bacillus sp. V5-8f]